MSRSAKTRVRAHFVGAPFFVPKTAKSMQERFAATGYNTGNLLIGDAVARLTDIDVYAFGAVSVHPRERSIVDVNRNPKNFTGDNFIERPGRYRRVRGNKECAKREDKFCRSVFRHLNHEAQSGGRDSK